MNVHIENWDMCFIRNEGWKLCSYIYTVYILYTVGMNFLNKNYIFIYYV